MVALLISQGTRLSVLLHRSYVSLEGEWDLLNSAEHQALGSQVEVTSKMFKDMQTV